jgi:hypothetical protein
MESRDFAKEVVCCEWEYYTRSERLRADITFQRWVAIKNPWWSQDEVIEWIDNIKRHRAEAARWREEQRNPTPIRSRQLCYNCKVPWELDHRCRGKGKKHIIEVHYDNDDEVC